MGNRGLKRYFYIFLILLVISVLNVPAEASPADGYIYLGKIQIDHISTTFPDRIALDSRGNLYVVDGYNDHVMRYDRQGNYTGDIKVEDASAVAVAPDGRLYIGANGASPLVGIYEGDTLKGYLGKGDGEFGSVRDIAIDEDTGNVYVVDSKRNLVGVYTPNGEHIRDIGGLSYPQAVDVEASEVYIVDAPVVKDPTGGGNTTSARVSVYDSEGRLLRSFEDFLAFGGHMVRPQDITVDEDGYILIPEAIAQAVLVYDGSGNYIGQIKADTETLYIARSTALGRDRKLYVSSNMTKSILIFGLDGYTDLQVSPQELNYLCQPGVAPQGQQITISNTGTGSLEYEITATEDWIKTGTGSGSLGPGESKLIEVDIDTGGLQHGNYTGRVVVSTPTGATEEVNVELQVVEPPRITVTPQELYFTATAGGSNPSSQVLVIQIQGEITDQVVWTATAQDGWLNISPATGTGDTVTQALVGVDITGLAAGVYDGRVVIEASGVENSPIEVPVQLHLSSSGSIHVITNLPQAGFRITGPAQYEGTGMDWSVQGVPDGVYRIEYSDVSGYTKPLSEEKVLSGGGEIEFRGQYREAKQRILVSYDAGRRRPAVVKIMDETGRQIKKIKAFPNRKVGLSIATGDIDGDGVEEIVAGLLIGGSEVALYRGNGEEIGRFTAFWSKKGIEVATGDVDGDGVEEIVVAGRRNGKVRVFSYQAGQIIDTGVHIKATRHKRKTTRIAACDTDGDMKEEIITFTGTRGTTMARLWQIDTEEPIGNWTAHRATRFNIHKRTKAVTCTDTDGDGRAEIYTVTNRKLIIYDTQGHKISELLQLRRPSSIAIADINGDGAKEIIIGRTDGTVELWDMEGQRRGRFRAFGSHTAIRVSTGDIGL